jgi:hypothetical protein
MKLKYEYKEKIYEMSLKDINKLDAYFKSSLTRKVGISIYDYLSYLDIKVEKCRICKCGNVPIKVKFEIVDDYIKVIGFEYTKKIYCYKDNLKCEGIKMNSNSFEFISLVENVSIEEANKILKERNSSPFYKENFKTEEEYIKSQSRSLEYYIGKYGEDGEKLHKKHIEKISYSNSLDRYINEFGEKEGKIIFNEISSNKDSMSYNYFLKKNNNNNKLTLFEYNKRLESVNVSVENWIKKYGYEKAIQKNKERVKKSKETFSKNPNKEKIFKSRGITIENLYNKYGDMDVAKKKYNDWLTKITVPLTKASKESLTIFNPLIDKLIELNIKHNDIYIGSDNKDEYFIRDDNKIFFYDFTIRSKKIIIEYNGVLFHPKNENSNWTNPFNKNITTKEAYNKQQYKINLAKNKGFSILEIWSDDDKEFNINKCLEFIKNNI